METLQEHTTKPQLAPSPRRSRRPSALTILGGAVALVVVAALALTLVQWRSDHGKLHTQTTLRASANKAAETYAVAFGSYDYNDLHGATAPWTVIEQHATARFRSDYQKTSSALEPTITQYKATAKATVPISAVSSITPSKAVVLLQLSQTITNSTQKSGAQTQQFLVVMTLLQQKGHWLIDNVQASV